VLNPNPKYPPDRGETTGTNNQKVVKKGYRLLATRVNR
jgi:hypothetical protein